jgi:hypothetical protein
MPIPANVETVLVALQIFQVLHLAFHDWVPLGRLNDLRGVRSQNTVRQLIVATLINAVPYAILLIYSLRYFHRPWPHWLGEALWIAYGILFAGELLAWWIPWLFGTGPERAARYQAMFGNTHVLLPVRNGITPNTAHLVLHLATAATLVTLWAGHV